MKRPKNRPPTYYRLIAEARDLDTQVWLGDDEGHLVATQIGKLDGRFKPGLYTVEFGLGNRKYRLRLNRDIYIHESNINPKALERRVRSRKQ